MKIKDITEAPLTQRQEKQFISHIEREQAKEKGWSFGRDEMAKLLKRIEPRAQRIGKGAFGIVYAKPRGRSVVKVASDSPEALKYIKWCAQHQNNPHVPKIYTVYTTHESANDAIFYVRMEPLVALDPAKYHWTEKHLPFLFYMDREGMHVTGLIAKVLGSENPSKYRYGFLEELLPPKQYKEFERKMSEAVKTDPLCQPLIAAEKILDYSIDVFLSYDYAANIMLRRKTQEIVITDPVAG